MINDMPDKMDGSRGGDKDTKVVEPGHSTPSGLEATPSTITRAEIGAKDDLGSLKLELSSSDVDDEALHQDTDKMPKPPQSVEEVFSSIYIYIYIYK